MSCPITLATARLKDCGGRQQHKEKRVARTEPLGQVGKNYAVIVHTDHQFTDLLHILRRWHFDQCGHLFRVWA